jgi:hypothetical protein
VQWRWKFRSSVDDLGELDDPVRLLTAIAHLNLKKVRETLYELNCVSEFIGLLCENATFRFTGNRF